MFVCVSVCRDVSLCLYVVYLSVWYVSGCVCILFYLYAWGACLSIYVSVFVSVYVYISAYVQVSV